MPYNSKTFGLLISRLRVERGLSQEKLSGLAGISRSHLAMIECGRKIIRLNTLWQLAEALSIPPHELLRLYERADQSGR